MLEAKSNDKKPNAQQELAPPRHVAIIMDGNGRWAKKRLLPKIAGHKKGVKVVRKSIQAAKDMGVKYLTLYAFSSENWNRPHEEVNALMGLLQHYLKKEVKELHEKDIKITFIGDRSRLNGAIISLIEESEEKTRNNTTLELIIAMNYGGQAEIVRATKLIAEKVKLGEISSDDITEEMIHDHLYTANIPDPDLIIRTSGEQRLSNFLLWQAAYSEFVFMDLLWPDFTEDSLAEAIKEYHKRDRRYGARS
jgi:undecaprenyl diphosphate synthase